MYAAKTFGKYYEKGETTLFDVHGYHTGYSFISTLSFEQIINFFLDTDKTLTPMQQTNN